LKAAKARQGQVGDGFEDGDDDLHGNFDLHPAQTGGTMSSQMSSDTPSADLDGAWDTVPFEVPATFGGSDTEDPFNGQEFEDSEEDEEPVDLMSQISRQPGGMLVGAEAATAAWDPEFGANNSPPEQSPTSHQQGWGDAFQEEEDQPAMRMFDRSRTSPKRVPRLQMDRLRAPASVVTPPAPAQREDVFGEDPFAPPAASNASPYAPFGSPPEESPNPFGSPAAAAASSVELDQDDDYRPFG